MHLYNAERLPDIRLAALLVAVEKYCPFQFPRFRYGWASPLLVAHEMLMCAVYVLRIFRELPFLIAQSKIRLVHDSVQADCCHP